MRAKQQSIVQLFIIALSSLLFTPIMYGDINNKPIKTLEEKLVGKSLGLVFKGNLSFTAEEIRRVLFRDKDVIVALSPNSHGEEYLSILQKKITSGYLNNGFYQPKVNVSVDSNQKNIVVEINEGIRYKKGKIIIDGINDSSRTKLIEMLHSENLKDALTNVSIAEIVSLKGTFRFPFTWNETDWVCFDESFIKPSKQYVDQLLNLIGYYNAEFDLKVVPIHKNHTAELHIIFTKEGTIAKISTIDITGNTINTDGEVVAFLGLEKVLVLDSLLINRIQNKLRESGRFRQHTVSYDIDKNDPNNSTLKINLQEVPSATSLGEKLSEKEELMQKVGMFFTDYRNWNEDLCFTLSIENKYLPYVFEGVISPQKGFVLTEMDGGDIINSLVFQPPKIQYLCLLLGHYAVFNKPKIAILGLNIVPDDQEESGWIVKPGLGIYSMEKNVVSNELSDSFQMDIPPAFWISETSKKDNKISYIENVAIIELKGGEQNSNSVVIKADREIGRVMEINIKGKRGFGKIQFQKGAFEKQAQKVQKQIIQTVLEPTGTNGSGANLFHSLLPLYLTHFPNDTLSMYQKRMSLEAWNRILSSDIAGCFPQKEQRDTDDIFSLPHYDSMSSMNNMFSSLAGAAFGWCHENLPQDHWLRTLAHVISLATSGHGQNEAVSQGMQTLYTSEQIGPVGYYLIAKTFQLLRHPAYNAFNQRVSQTLTLDDFRKDWKPLVTGEFKIAQNIRCIFDKLRECKSEDIHSAASILPDKAGVYFETIINQLKESKKLTLIESLDILLTNEWPAVKEAIRRFLLESAPESGPANDEAMTEYQRWEKIYNDNPTGQNGQNAFLEMARSLEKHYETSKDLSALIYAKSLYEDFKLRYPSAAKEMYVDEAIKRIDKILN